MIDTNGNKTYLDMQSKLEYDMPNDENIMAVKACLNYEVDLFLYPLDSLNLAPDFVSTHALSGRSENDRKERHCFNCTKFLTNIGPNGMKALALA